MATSLLVLACGSELVTDEPVGGGGSTGTSQPLSVCGQHLDKASCCVEDCLWFEPSEGFAGACFSKEDNCAVGKVSSCAEGELCLWRELLTKQAECEVNSQLAGVTYGVCLATEVCPAEDECY